MQPYNYIVCLPDVALTYHFHSVDVAFLHWGCFCHKVTGIIHKIMMLLSHVIYISLLSRIYTVLLPQKCTYTCLNDVAVTYHYHLAVTYHFRHLAVTYHFHRLAVTYHFLHLAVTYHCRHLAVTCLHRAVLLSHIVFVIWLSRVYIVRCCCHVSLSSTGCHVFTSRGAVVTYVHHQVPRLWPRVSRSDVAFYGSAGRRSGCWKTCISPNTSTVSIRVSSCGVITVRQRGPPGLRPLWDTLRH